MTVLRYIKFGEDYKRNKKMLINFVKDYSEKVRDDLIYIDKRITAQEMCNRFAYIVDEDVCEFLLTNDIYEYESDYILKDVTFEFTRVLGELK